jgi:prolyl 4-hydroxylase
MERSYIKNDKEVTIFTVDNFLTEDECDYLCEVIEKNNYRSQVAGDGNKASTVLNTRTSHTSTLNDSDFTIKKINEQIANEIQIPYKNGETLQGQIYQVGQEFKHHHDWFVGDGYTNHCLSSGQRTWTCMIYLNDVEEGGETDFPNIELTFSPKKGKAVFWNHFDNNKKENPNTLHAGLPVIKGKKIIITKWFREKEWVSGEDDKASHAYYENKKTETTEKIFKSSIDLPRLSPLGFKVVKVPINTWRLINEAYQLLQGTKTVEKWDGIENFIHDVNGNSPVEIFNMDYCHRIKEIIIEELQPIHEEFIEYKEKIKPKWIYGIRSYQNGAILEPHVDTLITHHISSIIVVDKKIDKDWPLDIQDHQGRWHKVYIEPGEMVLYESAICQHGRTEPFEGEYFRNFFIHYTLSDYKYIG